MTEALWTRRHFLAVTGLSVLGGLAACGTKQVAIPVHTALPYVAAEARDGGGRVLGMSATVPTPGTA